MADDKKFELTQEDLDNINKDIEEAKKSLAGDKPEETKPLDAEALKKQILEELLAKQQQEKEEAAKAEEKAALERELALQKQRSEEELNALKAKIDAMAESKAVVDVKSPFQKEDDSVEKIMEDKDRLRSIDEASRQEFFKQRGHM